MPLGDIAGEMLGGVARFIATFFVEVIFEILIKGAGYAIIRSVRPKSEPGETACTIVGLTFWAGVVVLGLLVYRHAVAA